MLRVETGEFLRSAEDVGDLVVGVHKGKPVYLREVAEVKPARALPQRYVWFTPGAASVAAAAGGGPPVPGGPGLPGGDAHRDQEARRERGGRGPRRAGRAWTRCATR
jgi:hypothetical protein